jgi:hypothetical protein
MDVRQRLHITVPTGFSVHRLVAGPDEAQVSDGVQTVTVDRIVSATGSRPDHSIAAELRLGLDPILGSTRLLAP